MAKKVELTFTNFIGAFPTATSINATGAGATDGTEFVKAMIDGWLFGPQQALLNRAGLIPDGITESATSSQTIEATHKAFNVGPGIRVMSDLNTTETAKYRILPLNGQGVDTTTYADLVTAAYVGDGNNAAVGAVRGGYYKATAADGLTPNIAGTFLILPESRGYSPRGLDTAATIDPDGASRYLGDNQSFALENITGSFESRTGNVGTPNAFNSTGAFALTDGASVITLTENATLQTSRIVTLDASTVVTTSTETRMANISTNFVVGY